MITWVQVLILCNWTQESIVGPIPGKVQLRRDQVHAMID
jgi:hypothetical protein